MTGSVKGRVLAALLLTILATATAASASSSTQNYDAGRSHDCFAKSSDYVPLNWYPGKPGARQPGRPFQLLDGGYRTGYTFHGRLPYFGTTIGSGHHYAVSFMATPIVTLVFFETVAQAHAMYHQLLSKVTDSVALKAAKADTKLVRNVFIEWGIDGLKGPPKQVRSIILGCLRTA
jgi:hypothetical protein